MTRKTEVHRDTPTFNVFLFLAEMGFHTFLITVEEEKQSEEQPMTVTTKKKTPNTTSAQRILFYMHSVDQCTLSQINSLLPSPTTDAQTL